MALADLGFLEALTHLYTRNEAITLTGPCDCELQILKSIGYKTSKLSDNDKCPTVLISLGDITQHADFEGYAKSTQLSTAKHVVIDIPQAGCCANSTIHTHNFKEVIHQMELIGFNYSSKASKYLKRRQHQPKEWHHFAVFHSAQSRVNLNSIINILTNVEHQLRGFSKALQLTKLWLTEAKKNAAKHKSRATTIASIKRNQRCKTIETQNSDKAVLATVNHGALKHVIVSPAHAKRFAQTHQYGDAVIQLDEESVAIFKDVQNVRNDVNTFELPEKAKSSKLIMTTLFLADHEYLQPWIKHYRKMGVQYFLLYFNGSEIPEKVLAYCNTADDISLIGWDFSWWEKRHLKGKSNHHIAQPAQLGHAKLLMETQTHCKHLLACDLDEYIIGPKQLDTLINLKPEITFANLWAEASFSAEGPDWQNARVPKEWMPDPYNRTKALRAIASFRRVKIHRNQDLDNLHPDFVMFHFHKMTHGSLVGRKIQNDNFSALHRMPHHPAYPTWRNRFQ